MDGLLAYLKSGQVVNKFENWMRLVESSLDIPPQGADEFRQAQAAFFSKLAAKRGLIAIRLDANTELKRAIIQLDTAGFRVSSKTGKINQRMGLCRGCATVASHNHF